MQSDTKENKFKEGTEVYAKADPDVKLMIRRYVDRLYYCKTVLNPGARDLVYFERELSAE